jgi:hypothetical protein
MKCPKGKQRYLNLKREIIASKWKELDTELAKTTPDLVKVLKLYQEIGVLKSSALSP